MHKLSRCAQRTVFCAVLSILIGACTSEHTPSRLELLTAGSSKTWVMLSDSSFTGLQSNPCLFDNEYVFDTSGAFINRDSGLRCFEGEEPELRAQWTMEEDSATLSFGPGRKMRITALSDTLMVIEELAPPHNRPERRSIFAAKR